MKNSPKSPEALRRRNRTVFFIALAVIVALLLLFCNERLNENGEVELRDTISVATASQPVPRELVQKIVPGERIGDVSLGQTTESLRILGQPTRQDAAMGKSWAVWEAKDGSELDVFTTYKDSSMRAKVVKLIRTTSNGFRNGKGLGPGASTDSLKTFFPHLKRVATYSVNNETVSIWDDVSNGIAYETDEQRCIGVIVHDKGEDVTRYYRTFQPEMIIE